MSRRAGGQAVNRPPLARITAPTRLADRSLARKATTEAISSAVAVRREVGDAADPCNAAARVRLFIGVSVGPGATALTRTPDPIASFAIDWTSAWTPALDAA